jgi:hypothetical protein
MNLTGMKIARLQSWLTKYQRELADKRAVMVKHTPGSAYHTRASREATAKQERIDEIQAELRRR